MHTVQRPQLVTDDTDHIWCSQHWTETALVANNTQITLVA